MRVENTRTCWPALRFGAPARQTAELLEPECTTGASGEAVSHDIPMTNNDAPTAQGAPGSEQANMPACREDPLADEQAGVDMPRDEEVAIRSVAKFLAMGGATGAMHHAAGVAPPPPSGSSAAATAAPQTATVYTAATSAAEGALYEAQLACGYDDPSSDSDGEADGAGSDADEEDAGVYDPHVSPPAGHYWTYASPYAAAHVDVGDFAGAALESGRIPLRPAVWTDMDGASTDDDVPMSSEEE